MTRKKTTTVGISKHDLIPVPLAARIVYQRAYGAGPPEAHLSDRLNGLAYCLASVGGVYAIEEDKTKPRPLSSDEIACGHFRNGGKELHFLDQRAPVLHLGVTRECIEKAVRAIALQGIRRP
jgi:hypothetical protein